MELSRRQIGSVLVVSFDEPLALEGDTSQWFKDQVRALVGKGGRRLVIDLGRVEFIDSSGLGALISALKSLRGSGGDLRLANVTGPVQKVLEITRLLRVFDVHEDPEDARRALEEAETAASGSAT